MNRANSRKEEVHFDLKKVNPNCFAVVLICVLLVLPLVQNDE